MSALRRMRATDSEINFKPWIYQIARNAAIDSYRRNSHAVEVSMDSDDGLRASDRHRLVGIDGGPDSVELWGEPRAGDASPGDLDSFESSPGGDA